MIEVAKYFWILIGILGGLAGFLYLQMSGEQRKSRRAKLLPVIIVSFSFGLPFGLNSVGVKTLKSLEKMEEVVAARKDFENYDFLFAFKDELDIIRNMNEGIGKLSAVLRLAPVALDWKPELVDVQVSLIQATKACYPSKWGVLKEDLFQIPLDKKAVKSLMEKELKEEDLDKNNVFCDFETLIKLV